MFGQQLQIPESRIGNAIIKIREEGLNQGIDRLRKSYMRLFDLKREPFAFESEYVAEHFQQQAAIMADLMGFYKAFGVSPDCERCDHISCELDFLQLLSFKRAKALQENKTEEAKICLEAKAKFLDEHLLQWYEEVIKLVNSRAIQSDDSFYLKLCEGLEILMSQDSKGLTNEQ